MWERRTSMFPVLDTNLCLWPVLRYFLVSYQKHFNFLKIKMRYRKPQGSMLLKLIQSIGFKLLGNQIVRRVFSWKIDGIFIKVSSHFKVEMIFGRKSCVRQLLMLLLFVCGEPGARLGVGWAAQPQSTCPISKCMMPRWDSSVNNCHAKRFMRKVGPLQGDFIRTRAE